MGTKYSIQAREVFDVIDEEARAAGDPAGGVLTAHVSRARAEEQIREYEIADAAAKEAAL